MVDVGKVSRLAHKMRLASEIENHGHEDYQREAADVLDDLVSELDSVTRERDVLRAARIAYASEFPLNEDGEPDVGNVHANIRKLKAYVEKMSGIEFAKNVEKLLAKVPRAPNAITFEKGWELLDGLQRLAEEFYEDGPESWPVQVSSTVNSDLADALRRAADASEREAAEKQEKFEKAMDELIYASWESGKLDGKDGVAWVDFGKPLNTLHRVRIEEKRRVLRSLIKG